MTEPLIQPRAIWVLRGLLAIMLAFGTEILLWTDPTATDLGEWIFKAVTYFALACITLDLIVRYRVNDLYGLMLVVPFFALMAGLLINPEFSHESFPNTLITRVIGGNGTFGLMMVGLLLTFTDGSNGRYRRLLIGYCIWLGFYWGVWVRWTPELTDRATEMTSQSTMLTYGVGFIALILVAFATWAWVMNRTDDMDISPANLKLTVTSWGGVIVILLLVLIVRGVQERVEIGPLAGSAALIALSWAILWSQRQEKGRSLFHSHLPPTLVSPLWVAIAVGLFLCMAMIGYERPLLDINGYGQYSVMEFLFAAVGFAWFPLVASVMSVRAIDRQSRISPGY